MTTIGSRIQSFYKLLTIDDLTYRSFMDSYNLLFDNSPECTKADYEDGKSIEGYVPGSSGALASYYQVIHLLCSLGSVEKMYMPGCRDLSKSVSENQVLLEREISEHLSSSSDSPVLDLGCGCGCVAFHISSLLERPIYGINLDDTQILKGQSLTVSSGRISNVHLSVGDFNEKLKFGDKMFSGAYAIQPMTYCTDLVATLKEVHRVLEDGGVFVINDVAALDNYDPSNWEHKELMQHTRELTGFGALWHFKYWEKAFDQAGFDIILSEGTSAVEMIKKEKSLYDGYERVGETLAGMCLFPRKFAALLERMNRNCSSYIRAEELGLLSLNWLIVATKRN